MARGINKVILIGNLGQDPEVKYTQSGGAVVNVSLATTEGWKDRNSGQMQEKTEWHRLVFFNKLAEIVGQYLRKGSQVYVEGRLQTRRWQGQDGQNRYTTEIVVNNMQMLGGRGGGSNDGFGNNNNFGDNNFASNPFDQSAPAAQQAPAPQQSAPAAAPAAPNNGFDDDIPF